MDANYLRAWIYCLLRANHKSEKVKISGDILTVERGSFITSRAHFARDTGLSEQETRTFWKLLEQDGMLAKQTTSQATKLTVCNYDTYNKLQPSEQPAKQPGTNQAPTTDNNDKNGKNSLKENKYSKTGFVNPFDNI